MKTVEITCDIRNTAGTLSTNSLDSKPEESEWKAKFSKKKLFKFSSKFHQSSRKNK